MSKAKPIPEPYYQDPQIIIYNGDSRELGPRLGFSDTRSVYLDPPYNIKKAAWDFDFPHWQFSLASQLAPTMILSPGLNNLLNCPPVLPGAMRYLWTLSAHITNGCGKGLITHANWIPGLIYTRPGVLKAPALKYNQDCKSFSIGGKGERKKANHPSPKPYSIMRWFINFLPGEEIVDFFMGSGTTLRAAKDLGKRAIGIESNETYCRYAADRMTQDTLFPEQTFDVSEGEILGYLHIDDETEEEIA